MCVCMCVKEREKDGREEERKTAWVRTIAYKWLTLQRCFSFDGTLGEAGNELMSSVFQVSGPHPLPGVFCPKEGIKGHRG